MHEVRSLGQERTMQPQNWRSRNDRSNSNEGYNRGEDFRGRDSGNWESEQQGRGGYHTDDDYNMSRGGGRQEGGRYESDRFERGSEWQQGRGQEYQGRRGGMGGYNMQGDMGGDYRER